MKIGRYELKKRISIGGMGEIYLAHDTMVHRDIALKKIKAEKSERKYMKRRFLREAMLTARLTHPSIIPIYSVHQEGEEIYYTMPFIEGKSMKSLIKEKAHEESLPRARADSGASIPNMVRHFLAVSHAIDYAHSQKILHRDLKPDNIMIGKFGEVYLLDWGIAGYADEEFRDSDPVGDLISHLTLPGAIPGTLPFMAPELASGKMPTVQSEVFALGVLLYLILTLDIPFHRTTIDDFKKTYRFEKLVPPEEHAPHRDIPRQLSDMAQKCLAFHPDDRYQSVRELIDDLENYIEGKPDWSAAKKLDIQTPDHWEFQENVLLTKHMAVTRVIEEMEWVVLMLSKEGFAGNVRLSAKVRLHDKSHGVGFLISVPDPSERKGLEDGYTLWIGSPLDKGCTLFRNNAEVISLPNLYLPSDKDCTIVIERIDTNLRMYVNGALELNYNSLVPMTGTHIGMLYRDADFDIEPLAIETGSQNVMVKCLSIPDAFLANKDFEKAYTEYKRIAASFKGRSEERDALFRAGITKIEEGKAAKDREPFFNQARHEFEKLRSTPGAPMEYLGKSLIYVEEGEIEEEIKCLELAIRKYPRHPHLAKIEEHIIFRLHETSQKDRVGAYRFALLAAMFLPETFDTRESRRLLDNLIAHWEALPFIVHNFKAKSRDSHFLHLSIQLAFWLSKPITLTEIIKKIPRDLPEQNTHIGNALFALIEMGHGQQAHSILLELRSHLENFDNFDLLYALDLIEIAYQSEKTSLARTLEKFFALDPHNIEERELRTLEKIFDNHLCPKSLPELDIVFQKLYAYPLADPYRARVQNLEIRTLLFARNEKRLAEIFSQLPPESLHTPSSPLFSYYACYLALTDGEKAANTHLSTTPDDRHPATYALLAHHLENTLPPDTFKWERLELYRYLEIYFISLGKPKKADTYRVLLKKELYT